MKTCAVVVPIYNGEKILDKFFNTFEIIVKNFNNVSFFFIFVNDNSNDQTKAILNSYNKKNIFLKKIKIINNLSGKNYGHGKSLVMGLNYVLSNESIEYIFTTDADINFNSDDLKFFFNDLNSVVKIGERPNFHDGNFRFLVSKILKLLCFLKTGNFINDINCPVRLYNKESATIIMKSIENENLIPNVSIFLSIIKHNLKFNRIKLDVKNLNKNDGISWKGNSFFSKYLKLLKFSLKALRFIFKS